ncbi:MAG: hypothetical protein MRJ92_13535 [Nitrospira sp.]|nr:hypothetical protein [Nitrospira sp.]
MTFKLLIAPDLFRCFHGIKRLVLNNVGLNEHRDAGTVHRTNGVEMLRLASDRQPGKKAQRRPFWQAKALNVASVRQWGLRSGRVWSNLRLRVDTFSAWAKGIGQKLIDETIDSDAVLSGTRR